MPLRVLIVDDNDTYRQGLREYLAKEPEIAVLGDASDGWQALRLLDEIEPDVVLVDLAMPGLSGIETTRRILAAHPDIKVLGLSIHAGRPFAQAMLDAGASGLLPKDGAWEELTEALRALASRRSGRDPSA